MLNVELPYDLVIPCLGIYSSENICPHKSLYMNIHNSIIYNSQKVETTQMLINWQMDKQNVLYPYNGILFSNQVKHWHKLQHGWTLKILCLVNEASHKRPHIIWIYLYEMSRIRKSLETESSSFLRLGEVGMGKTANGMGVAFGVMKIFWIRQWWWLHYSAHTKNHWITYFKRVDFIVCKL